jgi:hypothetical protein
MGLYTAGPEGVGAAADGAEGPGFTKDWMQQPTWLKVITHSKEKLPLRFQCSVIVCCRVNYWMTCGRLQMPEYWDHHAVMGSLNDVLSLVSNLWLCFTLTTIISWYDIVPVKISIGSGMER